MLKDLYIFLRRDFFRVRRYLIEGIDEEDLMISLRFILSVLNWVYRSMGPQYREGIRENYEIITASRLEIIINIEFGLQIYFHRFLNVIILPRLRMLQ